VSSTASPTGLTKTDRIVRFFTFSTSTSTPSIVTRSPTLGKWPKDSITRPLTGLWFAGFQLIANLTQNLHQDILEGHQTGNATKLVLHNGQVAMVLPEQT
jgi:hypothetical protein